MYKIISSDSNSDFKELKKLKKKKGRKQLGKFLVEGPIVIEEAILETTCYNIYYDIEKEREYKSLLEKCVRQDIPICGLSTKLFKKVADTVNSQGILGVFKTPVKPFKYNKPVRGKWIYADGLQDPGNIGGMIRSIEAFGFEGILLGPNTVDVLNSKSIRATMASIFRIQIITLNDKELMELLKDIPLLALDIAHGVPPEDYQAQNSMILAVGNEAHGLRQEILDMASDIITLPMTKRIDSLNVNVAASIAMYILRGRR